MTSYAFTHAERILLHLSRCKNNDRVAPFEISSVGIARAIGRTRSHISLEINKLQRAGLLELERAPVKGLSKKVYVARLTPCGVAHAERLKRIASDCGVDWRNIITAPNNERTTVTVLNERCTRLQIELDELRTAIRCLNESGGIKLAEGLHESGIP